VDPELTLRLMSETVGAENAKRGDRKAAAFVALQQRASRA
jgi:hypothetical protein